MSGWRITLLVTIVVRVDQWRHNDVLVFQVNTLCVSYHFMVRPMGSLIPTMWRENCWSGVDLVWLPGNFRKNSAELGQSLLTLVDGHLWDCTTGGMKDGNPSFPVVPHQDGIIACNVDVGSFPANFVFSSVMGLFLRAVEELGWSRELVYIFKFELVSFSVVLFEFWENCAYTLGLIIPLFHWLV